MKRLPNNPSDKLIRPGFSLIEIVVVLAIVAVMFGTAMMMVSSPQQEAEIREVHSDIEDLARQAREMSFSYQQPFVVELREGEVLMRPLANPDARIVDDLSESTSTNSGLKELETMSWPRVVTIDPKYELWVLRWGQQNFTYVTGETVESWIHTPNSPCEPVVIKLVSTDGNTLLSRKYHPLTAVATDDELEIRKPQ
ncbi:prepilin-type N-terminal cleavage/methylation domain-containing protein [Verrucomicrobiaceae bacterium 227]